MHVNTKSSSQVLDQLILSHPTQFSPILLSRMHHHYHSSWKSYKIQVRLCCQAFDQRKTTKL